MSEADVQAVLDSLAAELSAAIVLEDVDFRLLAHTDHGDVIDEVRRSSIIGRRATADVRSWFEQWGIREANRPVRTPAAATLGALARWCVPVRFRGTHFGYVWVLDDGEIAEERLSSATEAADHIGALLYRRRLVTEADSDLLRLLLIPNLENEGVAARAGGIYAHVGPVAVVVAGASTSEELGPDALSDLTLATRRAAEQTSPATTLGGVIAGVGVLLAPLQSREDLVPAQRLAESVHRIAVHVSHGLEFVAAIGGATELDRASDSYAEALWALRMMRAMPDLGPIVAWEDLGVFRALALLPRDEVRNRVLDPRVRRLLADEELATTAETFLDLAGNVQETAARLYLHRATLYQRLNRIDALYKLNLRRNGDHRLLTHLGLKLARVAGP